MTLKEWLKANPKVKQKDMAQSLGINPVYLSYLSNRKRRPSPGLAARIQGRTRGRVTVLELLYPK